MKRTELIKALNYFLFLEMQQVELYGSQSKSTDDKMLAKVLNYFKETEQQHVDNLNQLIKKLGGTPSSSYKYAGYAAGEGTKMVGSAFAKYTRVENMLKVNLFGENQAIKDYKKLIKKVHHPQIKDLLIEHLIEEELHSSWMEKRIKVLKQQRRKRKGQLKTADGHNSTKVH